jgi:subtilisin
MARRISLFVALFLCTLVSLAQAGEKKVIIGFRPAPALTEYEKGNKVQRAGGRIKRSHSLINAVSANLPEEEIAGLKNDPHVAYVEEDRVFSVVEPLPAQIVPSPEYVDSWGVLHIGADVAAMNGIKGDGVKVAVLDSGIDYNHPDLKDNYKGGYNFAYDNNDPFDDTRIGHGTHVAGIIAARDNGTGVVGVAPDASIYAVKVLNGGMMGSTSDILSGIEWAIANNMNVITMSFGVPFDPLYYSQAVEEACSKAYAAGIILVAAAGNSNQPNVDYPAAFDSVIAVSATARDDSRAPFSNYGTKTELAAPGVEIKSTVPGGGYAVLSGTSQAAPHVAGVAALILSAGIKDSNRNGNSVDEVRKRLDSTAHDLGDPGRDAYFGYGMVKAPACYKALRGRQSWHNPHRCADEYDETRGFHRQNQ